MYITISDMTVSIHGVRSETTCKLLHGFQDFRKEKLCKNSIPIQMQKLQAIAGKYLKNLTEILKKVLLPVKVF